MKMKAIIWLRVLCDRIRSAGFRLPGARIGAKVRIGPRCRLTHPAAVKLGARVWLEADVWLKVTDPAAEVDIGEHTFIARNCTLNAVERITIGSHTLFGPGCLVIDHNHGIAPEQRIDEQPCVSKPVCIGNDVWLGAGAVILPGVTVGNGAVIGANAVVTKDIPPMAVAVGNPARVIRMRNEACDVG